MTQTPDTEWPPIGRRICDVCDGSGMGPSEWHYVRGHGITNDCPRVGCDGKGHTRHQDDPRLVNQSQEATQ